MTRVEHIIEKAWEADQPITLRFRTMTSVPLEDALVLVRYNRRPHGRQ